MVDSHVKGKMLTESAQILSNCYTLSELAQPSCPRTKKGGPRKHSYPHHPCCHWVQQSLANFDWLILHAIALHDEKVYRGWPNIHFCLDFILWCRDNHPNLPDIGLTPPALAFSGFKAVADPSDPVESYKKFYVLDKRFNSAGKPMDIYTKRLKPEFWQKYAHLVFEIQPSKR